MRFAAAACVCALAQAYDLSDPKAAHTDMAIEMDEEGNAQAALASFRAAARFSPDEVTLGNLGVALLDQANPELGQQCKFWEEANVALRAALKVDPTDDDAKENFVKLYPKRDPPLVSKNMKNAIHWAQYLESEPNFVEEHAWKPKRRAQWETKVIQRMQQASEHMPDNGMLYENTCQAYTALVYLQEPGTALPTINRAQAACHLALAFGSKAGETARQLGLLERWEAADVYRQAKQSSADDSDEALTQTAALATRATEMFEAIVSAHTERDVQLSSSDAFAAYSYGVLAATHHEVGDCKAAQAALTRAVELQPDDVILRHNRDMMNGYSADCGGWSGVAPEPLVVHADRPHVVPAEGTAPAAKGSCAAGDADCEAGKAAGDAADGQLVQCRAPQALRPESMECGDVVWWGSAHYKVQGLRLSHPLTPPRLPAAPSALRYARCCRRPAAALATFVGWRPRSTTPLTAL
jgi:tetratricopeptide (TPR) repeat protein